MGAAGHIGRAGGLAVALGVGTAIFTGYGVASAAPESDASAGKTAESSSSATDASSTNPSTATAEAKASGTKDAAINAINLKVDKPASPNPEAPTQVVGAPTVTLHYSGLGTGRNVYAQLVDDKTGRVLGNNLTPIPVKLDGTSREITVSMEDVAYTMDTGDSLRLQIVASATPFENATAYGVINVSQVDLTLPTVSSGQVHFEQSFTTTKPPKPSVGVGGLLGI